MKYSFKLPAIRLLTTASLVSLFGSLGILLLIGHLTTPLRSGPLGILAVFTLIYIFFTSLIFIVTGSWSVAVSRLLDRPAAASRKRYYASSVLGLVPVLYLTLLSMGGASPGGIALIVAFTVLMLFYVLRRAA